VICLDQYYERQDDAGRFAQRLLREMDSLWVFLVRSYWIPGSWDLRLSYTDDIPFSNL